MGIVQDPLADGPTIHAAATRALLEQHVTLDQVCSHCHNIASTQQINQTYISHIKTHRVALYATWNI